MWPTRSCGSKFPEAIQVTGKVNLWMMLSKTNISLEELFGKGLEEYEIYTAKPKSTIRFRQFVFWILRERRICSRLFHSGSRIGRFPAKYDELHGLLYSRSAPTLAGLRERNKDSETVQTLGRLRFFSKLFNWNRLSKRYKKVKRTRSFFFLLESENLPMQCKNNLNRFGGLPSVLWTFLISSETFKSSFMEHSLLIRYLSFYLEDDIF